MTQRALEMRTFSGPSISAPFAAVAADFAIPETAARTQILAEALRHVLPETVLARLQALDWTTPFEALVAAAAQALLGWHGRNDFPCITNRTSSGRGQVFLGYHSEHATVLALTLGYDLVVAGWTRGAITVDPQSAPEARLTQFALTMERQPRELAQHLMRVARTRGIPFFPIGVGLGILQYGHGKFGRHFLGTSSHRDSGTGQMLQHNKVASNLLVKRLGFPGVEHGVADNIDNAQRLADQIGYPVVIKPIDSSQGRGVTPGITSGDEIPTAFAAADTLSPGRVIIERFVKGDTFRLAVFGGELAFATLRSPPQIVGTGDHTVAELIQIENQRRAEQQADAAPVSQLTVDASMLTTLQKQKLSLNDRVPAGQIVKLQSVANMRTGQISTVVTDRLHPDNREMAEAITRCFRLDTAGIDFVTPDIAGSWRAVPCAVIEVNSAPQFSFPESQARILLERAFPGTSTGRIASAIVVTGERGLPAGLSQILQHQGVTLGFAEPKSASLGGRPRFTQEVGLADRVTALLLDPACQAVVIASTTDDIVRDGLPIDRCDVCIVDPQITLTEPLRTLLTKCSSSLITDDSIEVALARWLAQMRASQP